MACVPHTSLWRVLAGNPRNASELVAMSRPQALRKFGRFGGSHFAGSWPALAEHDNDPIYPLDHMYSNSEQFYGLPSFAYGSYVLSHMWRYR